MKKLENVKKLDLVELQKKQLDLKEALRVLRFKSEGARSKNVKEAKTLKKQIAQILTEINFKTKEAK